MKISTRLLILVGGLTVAMVLMALLGLYGIDRSNSSLQTVYEYRTTPAVQLGQIQTLTTANRMHVAQALANPTPETISVSLQSVQANRTEIATLWSAFAQLPHDAEETRMAQDFARDLAAFETQGLVPALKALQENDITEAQSALVDKMTPLATQMKKGMDALLQRQVDGAKTQYQEASTRFAWIRTASLLSIVVGTALALGLGLAMQKAIVGQLGGEPAEANAIAERVGAGDLAVPLSQSSKDSNSLLARLHAMQRRLAAVVQQVRHAAQGVANASAEIAQGNQNLSQRTEQQSSALQQTASSMEELGAAIHGNAQRATQAYQLAQSATGVAQRCGDAVTQVVHTMKDIDASSHRIADIISVIDGIAFQTNILALNAAVEAARAGDQGRGFAVVASEVRALVGRSAQAAKETKDLIGHSVGRVQTGNAQVGAAGSAMKEVLDVIGQLQRIMGEISAASMEQSTGIGEVNSAISLVDQGTQQNAALVEEMAAAASGLRQQSEELLQSVLQFKLPHPTEPSVATASLVNGATALRAIAR
jgi:methyl-accepting chemotaxis protein-1 (serine sensor receptor)